MKGIDDAEKTKLKRESTGKKIIIRRRMDR